MRLTTIEKKVLAGFAATFVVLAVMGVGAVFSIRAFVNASQWVTHTYDVLQTIASVQNQMQRVELNARAYLITGNPSRLDQRDSAYSQLKHSFDSLQALTQDNRLEQSRIALLNSDSERLQQIQAQLIAMHAQQAAGSAVVTARITESYQLLDKTNQLLVDMRNSEKQLLDQRISKTHATAFYSLLMFGVLVLTMLAVKVYLFKRIQEEVRERERIDESLLETTHVLEITNKELESFSYSISHDLRSPLRAVNGFARILEREYGEQIDEEGRRLIGVIVRNSQKMSALIDDLLSFSKIGRSPVNKSSVDMAELVKRVHLELTATGDYTDTRFSLDDLPGAEGDPVLLTQVWSNLIGNAFKYSSKNETPEVVVSGALIDGESIYSVKDNGVGFDMTYYEKLFGVFQRLHSETEFEGTGVGLAITQRIITRHGGRVWAEASPNQGATFYFSLPRGLAA